MTIKKWFIRLSACGDGIHGFVVQCDACRKYGPDGKSPQEVARQSRREVFVPIKHRQGKKDVIFHICRRCLSEWSTSLSVTEFIATKRLRRQRQVKGGVR